MSAPVFQIEFTQDIKKPVLVQHCGNVVFTGDNLSDTISVSVLEDGEPYAISGTVSMNCIRADGATVTVTGSVSGNTASATLTQACVAIPGPLAVVIKVTSDTTTTTLLKAVYMVDVGVTGTAVDPGTIIPDVTTLINAIETAVGSIPSDYSSLLATIAPNFASGTYSAGQYVWNNGTLYKFTADHSGSWTGTDVQSVVIGDELTDLKSAITQANIPQIKADLRMKAPAITEQITNKNTFSANELNGYEDFTITCDASENSFVAVAMCEDYISASQNTIDQEYVEKGAGANVFHVKESTTTGSNKWLYLKDGNNNAYVPLKNVLPAGTVIKVSCIVIGEVESPSHIGYVVQPKNASAQDIGSGKFPSISTGNSVYTTSITLSQDCKYIQTGIYLSEGTHADVYVYLVLTVDNACTKVDGGSVLTWAAQDVGNNGFTVIPAKASVTGVVDTKKYIDDAVPEGMLTKEDLVYLSPEMYGAKGDGNTDDSTAIAACLAASIKSADVIVPIRGFGIYKTSEPIVLTGRHANVYLHEVIYTGSDAAIKIRGLGCKYSIDKIQAISENTAVGLKIDATEEMGLTSCDIRVGYIYSKSHTVEIVNVSPYAIMYNTFHFDYQKSAIGDIFHGNQNYYCNEVEVYGRTVDAQNGHFYSRESGTSNSIPEWRFHNYCIEQNVKYGIEGYAKLVQCRTGEFMNHIAEGGDNKRGVLFDFDGLIGTSAAGGAYTDEETNIVIATVDVSGAKSYNDQLAEFAQWKEDNPDADDLWEVYKLTWHPSVFKKVTRKGNYGDINLLPKFSMLAQYDKKIIRIEEGDWYEKFSNAETHLSLSFPTFFDINVAQAEIYLSYSYCCFGINKFSIKQYADKKAIIYDKFGNVLFDGTDKDAGVYQFECALKKYNNYVVDLPGGGTYTVNNYFSPSIYDFTNEVWHIYKLNEI